jgi:hypothetical protein
MIVSDFPQYKQIELSDKPLFDKIFAKIQPEISEYTFTNLYMWRNHYNFIWKHVFGSDGIDHIALISLFSNDTESQQNDKIIAFPPISTDIGIIFNEYKSISTQLNKLVEIQRFPDNLNSEITRLSSKYQFKMIEDPNNFDYVYQRSDLVNLAGGDFFNIRKKLNKFKRENKWEFHILDSKWISECLKLQQEWCHLRNCDDGDSDNSSLYHENLAIKDALEHWQELKFTGGILLIDGRIVAFSLGEKLNNSTFVVHVEKANPDFFGSYQAINQLFCEQVAVGYEFINREQDIGDENLRHAKTLYKPIKMGKKYIVQL